MSWPTSGGTGARTWPSTSRRTPTRRGTSAPPPTHTSSGPILPRRCGGSSPRVVTTWPAPCAAATGTPSPRSAGDGPDQGQAGQVLQEHRAALGIAERDPPVRVLVGGARDVLRAALADGVRERHADQRGRRPG